MSLWTKLVDWLVPRAALSSWTVPLRRVDPLKARIPEASTGPDFATLGTIGSFGGLQLVLSPAMPEGSVFRSGHALFVNTLTWEGGLAPWTANG